jgi:hypothetical protein
MDAIFVVANDVDHYAAWSPDYGGITFITSSIHYGRLMAHELGHVIADLGDEYLCDLCTSGEAPRAYTGGAPLEANLTVLEYLTSGEVDRAKIPWIGLIGGWTVLPTTVGASCYYWEAGAWEGGGTYATGIWRPQERCIMLYFCGSYGDFCQVCYGETGPARPRRTPSPVWTMSHPTPPIPVGRPNDRGRGDHREIEWPVVLFAQRRILPCWECPPEIPTEHRLRAELSASAADAAFTVVDERGACRDGDPRRARWPGRGIHRARLRRHDPARIGTADEENPGSRARILATA